MGLHYYASLSEPDLDAWSRICARCRRCLRSEISDGRSAPRGRQLLVLEVTRSLRVAAIGAAQQSCYGIVA